MSKCTVALFIVMKSFMFSCVWECGWFWVKDIFGERLPSQDRSLRQEFIDLNNEDIEKYFSSKLDILRCMWNYL